MLEQSNRKPDAELVGQLLEIKNSGEDSLVFEFLIGMSEETIATCLQRLGMSMDAFNQFRAKSFSPILQITNTASNDRYYDSSETSSIEDTDTDTNSDSDKDSSDSDTASDTDSDSDESVSSSESAGAKGVITESDSEISVSEVQEITKVHPLVKTIF